MKKYLTEDYLKILFDQDDHTCYGNLYATEARLAREVDLKASFICVNALDSDVDHDAGANVKYRDDVPRRADINVSKFRSFMFEMDAASLEDQLEILKSCGIPWSAITYSGSKSYHAVLSLENCLPLVGHNLDSIMEYKYLWKKLAAYIQDHARRIGHDDVDGLIDPSGKNPSRFTRYPNNFREDKEKIQELILVGNRISDKDFYEIIQKAPEVKQYSQVDHVVSECSNRFEFFSKAPIGLRRNIKFAPFADSAGMYPHVYRLALWAIDSTNVPMPVLLSIMEELTFPRIVSRGGYDNSSNHLKLAVEHAYGARRGY